LWKGTKREPGAWGYNWATVTGGHKYRDLVLQVGGLDTRLTSLLCKKIIVAKSKEEKTRWSNSRQIWQNLLRTAMAKKGCFANDDDDDNIHDLL
jgi:hypothetical protein